MSSVHADPPPPVVTEPSGINYATGPALGKGGFAICHRAERYNGSKPTGHLVALKIVKTKMEPAKLAQKFVTELQIHSKLSHPNVVTFYRAFSFSTSTYVVLELCPNGSLADMLKKRRHLTLPEIRRFVIQICGAVKYLHHRHIVHRDLKTGNLFLDANMNVKVGDFGLAALLVSPKEMEVTRRTTMCGTPNYLAPEILQKDKGHNEKVDLWAIGVIAYTLAVGKAPFHASTKEEIYKKLRSGTYTWPELSATANQSSDLRALVSSLLVPEEQRPCPDKIVSQSFFKMAFVPLSIPTTARERTPSWPEVAVPSSEVVQRGYSDSWYSLCKESGVGEPFEDMPFPLNGGRKIKSIVHDMGKEAQAGKSPTMPIPKDVVYISPVSDWDRPTSTSPEPTIGQSQRIRGLKEIALNEVANVRPAATSTGTANDADLMPPPPRPSARAGRSGTVRKAARTISEEAESGGHVVPAQDNAIPLPEKLPRARLATSNYTTSTLRERNSSDIADPSNQRHDILEVRSSQSQRSGTVKRSADASLARRPRASKPKERPLSAEEPVPVATLDELKKTSPVRRTARKRPAEADLVEVHEDKTSGTRLAPRAPSQHSATLNRSRKLAETYGSSSGADTADVVARITAFRDNLSSTISGPSRKSSRTSLEETTVQLPFVSRWVDYSRKHGVGYVLADGTVGCIINASSKSKTPVTHVLVRNGQRWLARVGQNFENMDQIPMDIREDRGSEGILPKTFKGLGSVREGPLAAEADRRKNLSVLWIKFGRYMCQALDGDEAKPAEHDLNFVRFYQRIGNVGIWVFANGCLQVHFPDHTKLVLSACGRHISATCISTEAAAYLSAHGELLSHHVTAREVYEDSVSALLYEGTRVRARIIRANMLAEKLSFITDVVSQWIRNGGLGRIDDDFAPSPATSLHWNGLSVNDGARKMDRVTVGRCGGDEGVQPIYVS